MGSTPLHEAVEQGHGHVVKFLLDHAAERGLVNEFGQTPLDIANLDGNEEISKILAR
jgi:ankyrin repeat protein